MFIVNRFVLRNCASADVDDSELTFDEAKNRPICHCELDPATDFDMLKEVAKNLYESIDVSNPRLYSSFLSLVGDRFSEVIWRENDYNSAVVSIENMEFLNRQLLSKHLRKLTIKIRSYYDDLQQQVEFNDLLVNFVKKPKFESLDCVNVPHEVVIEADRAWSAKRFLNSRYQEVRGTICRDTAEKLQDHFHMPRTEESIELTADHPVLPSAKRVVTMNWWSESQISFSMKFHYFGSEN